MIVADGIFISTGLLIAILVILAIIWLIRHF